MNLIKKANLFFNKKDYVNAYKTYQQAKVKYGFDFLDFNLNLCKKRVAHDVNLLNKLEQLDNTYINKSSEKCILNIDNINNNLLNGWALDKNALDKTIVLELFIDGKPYSIIETAQQRRDVQKIYGGDGYYGFRGEVHKYLTYSSNSFLSALPISHQVDDKDLRNSFMHCQTLLKGQHFYDVNIKAEKLVEEYRTSFIPNYNIDLLSVSVIILNLNGSSVLRECLSSLIKWNKNVEIIIVDHASTDDSIEMIKSFKDANIVIIDRDKNYSYSESNNLGARKASGDVLLFLNNDIVLTSDAISYMLAALVQTNFGLLGIKLWDYPKSDNFTLDSSIRVNQHLGVHFNCTGRDETVQAFELRNSAFIELESGILKTPAVTAAMMAVTKEDFFEIGGFNEKYFYGQEDVDFCLRYYSHFNKDTGVVLDHGAFHIRGLSRKGLSEKNNFYINNNRKVLQEELGRNFRKAFRREKFIKPGFWNHKPISIAMIVSEVSFETSKADFFTAKELGDVFDEDSNCSVGYFDTSSDYDMSGYDIVMVFIDGFNPKKLKNISPHCQLIAWARNWFDRWCQREWIEMYDIIYASSAYAQDYMQRKLKREIKLLRIAASTSCINHHNVNSAYQSDYVFTGSYFDSPREITDYLKPREVPFKFKLFGYNWENHDKFKEYTSGPVSYNDIPDVYSNTKLVIDDANIATKEWGALNCRVYDALANGTLCITNNTMGIKEIFDDEFPTYTDDGINNTVKSLLNDDAKRESFSKKYQKIVLEEHTYYNRKDTIMKDVLETLEKESVAIKIAAPDFARAVNWGDYYFAIEVRKELELLGYKVRIDCLHDWHGYRHINDDINIVLRGLNEFKVRNDQINLLWVISHPDLISEAELSNYDSIFVASQKYTTKLTNFLEKSNIEYLAQASSFNLNELDQAILEKTPAHEILFIGNSRNEYREVVKWCIEKNLPISIYGNGWEAFVPQSFIKGSFVDNQLIPYYYRKAKVVLNDHWKDMRLNGFISNRVYDVLAAGGTLLTDNVYGIENIDSANLFIYEDKKSFYTNIKKILSEEKKQGDINQDTYSFKNRVLQLNAKIQEYGRKL